MTRVATLIWPPATSLQSNVTRNAMDARRPIGVAPASVPVGTDASWNPGGLAARLAGVRCESSAAYTSITRLLENSLTIDLPN